MKKSIVLRVALLVLLIACVGCGRISDNVDEDAAGVGGTVDDADSPAPSPVGGEGGVEKEGEKGNVKANVKANDNVKVDVAYRSIDNVEVTLTNLAKRTLEYGERWELQFLADGEWTNVPSDAATTDIGLAVGAGESKTETVDLYYFYGDLQLGRYRIIKEMSMGSGEGRVKVDAVGEFEIESEESLQVGPHYHEPEQGDVENPYVETDIAVEKGRWFNITYTNLTERELKYDKDGWRLQFYNRGKWMEIYGSAFEPDSAALVLDAGGTATETIDFGSELQEGHYIFTRQMLMGSDVIETSARFEAGKP